MRVAVAGTLGRMGREIATALARTPGLTVVGGFARARSGEPLAEALGLGGPAGRLYDDIGALYEHARPDVVVDFTVWPVTLEVARRAVERGISPVIGATGWPQDEVERLAALCERHAVGAALVPNFALGAVLAMRFAEQAARWFSSVAIVELHHDGKRDAPSGTAKATAARVAAVLGEGHDVPIHSVRLSGLVAHQETLFGGEGETLTIRHDALGRSSFVAGVLLAVRKIRSRSGLIVGLDALLEEHG